MDGLRAVPPLGGPQAVDGGRFGNPYIPKASLPRLGLAGGDHSPCRGNNAPRCLYSDGRSAFAPAIVRCGHPVPVPSGGCAGRRTGALAPALPFLTVHQPLSPTLRAASPSASIPCRTALCRADRPPASLRLAAGRRLHKDGGSHTAEHLVCSCWRNGLSGLPLSPGLRPASVAACPLGPVRRSLS